MRQMFRSTEGFSRMTAEDPTPDIRQLFRSDLHRGRVALITGGGTGLGRAIALDLARCGADVVLAGRRREPLEKTAAEIAAGGARALVVTADIREEEQATALVDRALEEFGRIDILVNNAGGQFIAPAEDIAQGVARGASAGGGCDLGADPR